MQDTACSTDAVVFSKITLEFLSKCFKLPATTLRQMGGTPVDASKTGHRVKEVSVIDFIGAVPASN
jgi:hypothetical protein